MSGKLLACALALSYPFETQSVSLVGFSLGTQVIKSCLKTLHQLGALSNGQFAMIENVTLLGGAINFDGVGKEQKWRKIFGESVAGSIANIFSNKDYILYLYSYLHAGKQAAGRSQLPFEEEMILLLHQQEVALYPCETIKFRNRDITLMAEASDGAQLNVYATGHMNYHGLTIKIFELLQ